MDRRTGFSFRIVSLKDRERIGSYFPSLSDISFSSIYAYAVASTRHAAFIIGGRNKQYSSPEYYRNVIAKFQDNQWTRYGSLKKARHSHGAIVFGDQTMIIGGYSGGQT